MKKINVNGFEVPIVKTETELFTFSLCGAKYSYINEGVSNVMHIESNVTYHYKYYYNLYDINGNVIGENHKLLTETKKDIISCKDFNSRNMVLFIDGNFKLITTLNSRIGTMDEVSNFSKYLNPLCKNFNDAYYSDLTSKMDFLPTYEIINGCTRSVYGLFSRETIQMTYKELSKKIKQARKMFSPYINYDMEEDLLSMEDSIVRGLSSYLMLTETQYKKGRFNLINQLNKRLNYNINNKR